MIPIPLCSFFIYPFVFFLITTLQWQIISVQGKGTPPSLNFSDLWVFFITCMTPNFMSRLDRILQLNMKQIKFHLFSESKFACPSPLNEKPCIIKYLRRFMIQKHDVTFRKLSSKCATDSIPPFRRQLGNQTKHANLQRVFHEELMWL